MLYQRQFGTWTVFFTEHTLRFQRVPLGFGINLPSFLSKASARDQILCEPSTLMTMKKRYL